MAYVRLDTSNPARNPHWSLAPTSAEQTLTCPANASLNQILALLGQLERTSRSQPGRWVGYFSYDLGRCLIDGRFNPIKSDVPLFRFVYCMQTSATEPATIPHKEGQAELIHDFTRDAYLAAICSSKEYIAAGDIYQVNLAQRFTTGLTEPPRNIYLRLIRDNPALYGAFLDFGDLALLSNSPELFLRITPDGTITTRPIKGTRPRALGMEEELRDSIKDQAELNMIVDLERNDLGRICEIGSVKVIEPRVIEAHPTVYHGVSTIQGQLRKDVSLIDILRATFPGGSITGAPKIRAMQIIDELEPVPRGPYCGAIGYLSADGSMEFNIAIRTMVVKDGLVHMSVGGGIVADSDPEAEYEETLVKARAMFAAVGIPVSSA